jgi:hypothetical protein
LTIPNRIQAEDGCLARGRPDLGGQYSHQGGLARAIWTEKGEDSGCLYPQIDPVQGSDLAVIKLGKPSYINSSCHFIFISLFFSTSFEHSIFLQFITIICYHNCFTTIDQGLDLIFINFSEENRFKYGNDIKYVSTNNRRLCDLFSQDLHELHEG